jgi:hypothetical protein
MIGEYSVGKNSLFGWSAVGPEQTVKVKVYADDVFLRELRCDLAWPPSSQPRFKERPCGFVLNFGGLLRANLRRGAEIIVKGEGGELLKCRTPNMIEGAAESNEKLKHLLGDGWIIDKWGELKLPFSARPGRDQLFMDFYRNVIQVVEAKVGREFYLAYGSLLGLVRNNALIGGDDDIDCAYMSNFQKLEDVVEEFRDLARQIKDVVAELGCNLNVTNVGMLQISRGELHFDIFTSWIDEEANYNLYFGVSDKFAAEDFRIVEQSFMAERFESRKPPRKFLLSPMVRPGPFPIRIFIGFPIAAQPRR